MYKYGYFFGNGIIMSGNGSSLDPDVQDVFDRMPTLTQDEKDATERFILSEKAVNNYQKYDEFFFLALGSTNGLIGFKSKTATANGGIAWLSGGAEFNGTNGYINTNFNPSVDGVNYTINDCCIAACMHQNTPETQYRVMSCADGTSAVQITQNPTEDRVAINNLTNFGTPDDATQNTAILYGARTGNNDSSMGRQGKELNTSPGASISIPNEDFYAGARNNSGTADSFTNHLQSSILIAGGVDFDHVAHNDHIRRYLLDLGVSDPFSTESQPAIDRMSGLSIDEEMVISSYIDRENNDGNWSITDDVFFFQLGATNGAIGLKSFTGSFSGTNTFSNDGVALGSSDGYFDTTINLSTDPTNYVQDDATISAYVHDITVDSNNKTLWGAFDNTTIADSFHRDDVGQRIRLNTNVTNFADYATGLTGNTFVHHRRTNAANSFIYNNGIQELSTGKASATPPNRDIYLGCLNNVGTADQFTGATVASFAIGGELVGETHFKNTLRAVVLLKGSITDFDAIEAIVRCGITDPVEQLAIENYIIAEKNDGNWQLMDEIWVFSLSRDYSALRGLKTGRVATANGGVTFNSGAVLNGSTSYINTNFDLADDGVQFTNNGAGIYCFVDTHDRTGVTEDIFGANNGAGWNARLQLNSGGFTRTAFNSGTNIVVNGTSTYADNTLYSCKDINSPNIQYFEDTIEIYKGSGGTGAAPASGYDLYVGAINSAGTAANYFQGTINSIAIGSDAVDVQSHDTNLRQLLTDLGVSLP